MKRLLLGLLLVALAAVASAQVQVSSSATCGTTGAANAPNVSCSFTVSGHPNRLLMIGVGNYNSASTHTVTATYNGVSFTGSPSGACTASSAGTQRICMMYMKEANLPAAGSYTLQVNMVTNDSQATVGVTEYWNVDQTTPLSGDATNSSGSSSTPTITVVSATNDIAVSFVEYKDTKTMAVNGGETQLYNIFTNTVGYIQMGSSYEAGAASVVLDWLLSNAVAWKTEGISIHSAGTVPTATPTITQTPTATATFTATPTATQTFTPTPTFTLTPAPGACFPSVANAETAPGTSTAGTTNTLTNFDIGGEPNRLVAVWIGSFSTGGTNTISNVTFNGVAMTHMGNTQAGNSSGAYGMSGYYIKEADLPGAGSYTISEDNSVAALTTMEATELYNVDQTTPQAHSAVCGTNDAHPTCTITSVSSTSIVLDALAWKNASTATVDASQTQLTNQQDNSSTRINLATSLEAGAATVPMDWVLSLSSPWKLGGVSINGSASCVTPTPTNTPTRTFTPTQTPTGTLTPTAGNRVNVAAAPRREMTWGEYLFALLKGHIR